MRKLRKIINSTLAAALLTMQLAPGFLLPKEAQAIITSGEPAIKVLGQYDVDYPDLYKQDFTRGQVNGGPNDFGFSEAADVMLDSVNHRLFVIDGYGGNRILVFNLDSNNDLLDYRADYVIGQPDMYTGASGTTSTTLSWPQEMAWDSVNSRLFVTDSNNYRVLVFDLSSGITNGMAASYVLGQDDFTSTASGTTSTRFSWVTGCEYDSANSRLFVTDNGNSRVLVFDVATIANGEPAVNVLGQANFTSSSGVTTSTGMRYPNSSVWDSGNSRLFVVDQYNYRVTVYDLATIANGEPAINVLGQADLTARVSTTTSTGMNYPSRVEWDSANSRLFVSDNGANRVTVFNLSGGITNGMAASYVLGQANFTSSSLGGGATRMNYPGGMAWDSGNSYLYVGDQTNARFLKFDLSGGITDGMAASGVIGQPSSVSSWPPVPSGTSFDRVGYFGGPFNFETYANPADIVFDSANRRLFVADGGNRRILVHNTDSMGIPLDRNPDYVIGQADFMSAIATVTSSGFKNITGLALDTANSRLFAADYTNSRVLVFDLSSGITNGMAASYVLGQANFTSSAQATTSTGMTYPYDVGWDSANSRLFVADSWNRRVLVFDLSGGITSGMAASNVLGQANFTSSAQATTSTGMKYPQGLDWDGTNSRLFVSDGYNNRVLVYDLSSGITNGMAASNVLGQALFTTGSSATTSTGMNWPNVPHWDGVNSRLYVPESYNNRVLVFDLSSGITNGMAAGYVLGQSLFTTGSSATTSTGFNIPTAVAALDGGNKVIVSDNSNSRLLVFDASVATGTTTATTDSAVSLSRLKAGESSTFNLSFTLSHTLSSTLTVTFPAGFTVTAAATTASSSSCLSNFSYTSNTLTASKTLCAGPITLGGATVTLPSTPGAYTITWVNDDPGSATIIIVTNDQVTINATVNPTVSFLAVAQPAASTCANTVDLSGSDYTLALGTLNEATITESESLNGDSEAVERICTQGSTNATSGMAVTVKNANGSSGLVSSSVPADTIPSSASGQLSAGTPGYGICVKGSSLDSDSGIIPVGADPTATGSFSTYECESASGNIVALTGSAQGLWSAAGPTQDATAAVWVRVAISSVQPAHNDYADSLTFVATATY